MPIEIPTATDTAIMLLILKITFTFIGPTSFFDSKVTDDVILASVDNLPPT